MQGGPESHLDGTRFVDFVAHPKKGRWVVDQSAVDSSNRLKGSPRQLFDKIRRPYAEIPFVEEDAGNAYNVFYALFEDVFRNNRQNTIAYRDTSQFPADINELHLYFPEDNNSGLEVALVKKIVGSGERYLIHVSSADQEKRKISFYRARSSNRIIRRCDHNSDLEASESLTLRHNNGIVGIDEATELHEFLRGGIPMTYTLASQ